MERLASHFESREEEGRSHRRRRCTLVCDETRDFCIPTKMHEPFRDDGHGYGQLKLHIAASSV